MIVATIKMENDDYDWFAGPCTMPAVPPIGGHIAIIDKNANHQQFRGHGVIEVAILLL